MFLGEEGSSVLEPSGGVAGGTEAEVADSVTHWRVELNGEFKF